MWPLPEPGIYLSLSLIVALFFIGSLTSTLVERKLGKDPSEVVIDEVVGFLITMCGFCWSPRRLIVGFFVFRFFDIAKPFPARRIERLPGGWGIMTDDVIAGIYSNMTLRIILLILQYIRG